MAGCMTDNTAPASFALIRRVVHLDLQEQQGRQEEREARGLPVVLVKWLLLNRQEVLVGRGLKAKNTFCNDSGNSGK